MIVSHVHKIIFIKTVKTAGTSFEIALSKFCGPNDIITPLDGPDEQYRKKLGIRNSQNYQYGWLETFTEFSILDLLIRLRLGRRPRKYWNHISAEEIRRRLPAEIWQNYRKVAIVRNPFDRLVSLYSWKKQARGLDLGLADFFRQNPQLINRNRYITHIENKSVVDFWIRFENFEEDILELEKLQNGLFGLGKAFKSIHTKKVKKKDVSITAHENKDVWDLVRILCAEELSEFSYSSPRLVHSKKIKL